MKKIIIIVFAAIMAQYSVFAWGELGHEVIIEIAQRHLTAEAKANIAHYMPYDLKLDAVWMDIHRRDKEISFTHYWHEFAVDDNDTYDPGTARTLRHGDAVQSLRAACYILSDYKSQPDSVVIFHIRQLIHFVGDMHCPVHNKFPGKIAAKKCTMGSDLTGSFHYFYDASPNFLFPEMTAEEIAAKLDVLSKRERKKVAAGDYISVRGHRDYSAALYEWCHDIAARNRGIWDINESGATELKPDTMELSRSIVETDLQYAGYRLARLLNELFGK
jgi:hypothetical protein